MSGVATKTRRYVDLVKHTKVRLTDTRKGWPGLRMVMKYAVRVGGAHNHIFNLGNCILVKDNHIKIAGSIKNAIELLRSRAQHTFKIEVECETMEMVEEALSLGVEIIMFDNMDIDEMRAGLKLVNGRAMNRSVGRHQRADHRAYRRNRCRYHLGGRPHPFDQGAGYQPRCSRREAECSSND